MVLLGSGQRGRRLVEKERGDLLAGQFIILDCA